MLEISINSDKACITASGKDASIINKSLSIPMQLPWSELFNSFDQRGPESLTEVERQRCRKLARNLRCNA